MRLLIRADAAPLRGAGHVMRSLAIAEEARAWGWDVTVSAPLSGLGWVRAWALELGADVVEDVPDAESLVGLSRSCGAEIVLLDHYTFPDAMDTAARSDLVLANVEDGVFGRRPAHVVIDYLLGAEGLPRPPDGSVQLLRGVAYAPIRSQVRAARLTRQPLEKSPVRVAVLMGATDPDGLVPVIGAVLTGLGVQPAHLAPGLGLVQSLVDADAVISAAGVSAYELCCLGIPTGLIQLVDNQQANYDALTRAAAVSGLGTVRRPEVDRTGLERDIAAWLESPARLNKVAAVGAALVDGHGPRRIMAALAGFRGR